ncbi:MAG: 2-oxo acid dehydrogenase subunit E2 [Spirosomataceae bacterium]
MDSLNTTWRKIASTIYQKPVDSKIFGSVELDITVLERFIQEKRKTGLKLTLTHFFLLATARAINEVVPEFNTFVKRGNIYSDPQIDATVSVLLPNGEMGAVKMENVAAMTLPEVIEKMQAAIVATRKGGDTHTAQIKDRLAAVPWPLRGLIYRTIRFVTVNCGLSIPFLGLTANSFGAFVLSNIGSIGLDMGYPALFPSANVSFVLILGGVAQKPWVVEGQIAPRTIMTLGAALDHRVVDASHGGKLFQYLKKVVSQPQLLE